MTNATGLATAISKLIDAHLDDKPRQEACAEEWKRHCRVGDKLLELLLETIEVEDYELFSAIQEQQGMISTRDIAMPVIIPTPKEADALEQDETQPLNTTEIRKELQQALANTKKFSPEREQVYLDALNVTAVKGKWWIAEAARALNTNPNTMQAAVQRIDPEHPRLHVRLHKKN